MSGSDPDGKHVQYARRQWRHGLHRAKTAARKRREYLDTVFAAIPVEPFTREMAQLAAKIDAEARKLGRANAQSGLNRRKPLEPQ
jgi:predicted nucleic acid-binding protein